MQCRNNKRAAQKTKIALVPSPTVDEEVENVEYLDECVTDDIEEVSGSAHNSPAQHLVKTETTLEDTFYPNAVHCLIALYRDKYEKKMNDPQEIQKLYESVWEDISKDMRESYFDFDAQQVRQKFTQLRRQYFCVSSKKEADEFVYFQPLHEIYNDKLILNTINNEKLPLTARKNKHIRIHRDDALFNLQIETETRAIEERPKHTEEISVDDHNRNIECKDSSVVTNYKRERSESKETPLTNLRYSKRKLPNPQTERISNTKEKSVVSSDKKVDMTLADYNDAQQRRHEEKMSLLRQTLLLQERALDIQNKLLEQIINRVK
uniref:Myb/SANT-like DNA-binding domain-containing protein n=1 Tax=Zeugodacus cucurbitae TaxID=28588 RepID=A0A0A1XMG8_ZEUCU